jgi:hypothetical protein
MVVSFRHFAASRLSLVVFEQAEQREVASPCLGRLPAQPAGLFPVGDLREFRLFALVLLLVGTF